MNKNENNIWNSPILRAFVIIIVGTIAFELLFNLISGGGNMEHMSGQTGMSYGSGSIDIFLGGLLTLFIKLLLVVLVIALFVGVAMWIKKTFFQNTTINSSQFMKSITSDPIIKTVGAITVAVLGVILVMALLSSLMGGGFSAALSIAGLLYLLIKVLTFVLVISLILALVVFMKKQFESGAFNNNNNNTDGQSQPQNQSTVAHENNKKNAQ